MMRDIHPLMIVVALLGVGCARAAPRVAHTETPLTAASAEEALSPSVTASAETASAPDEAPSQVAELAATRASSNPATAEQTEQVSPAVLDRHARMRARPRWVDERERVRRSGGR